MDLDLDLLATELMENGYSIKAVPNMDQVDDLRASLCEWLRIKYGSGLPDFELLDKIHIVASLETDDLANALTIEAIQYLSRSWSFDSVVYNSCRPYLNALFGLDIHSQKGNNVVVQHPNSNRVAELHIDAPPTSHFELVCWLPLVDCYESKSFYIINKSETKKLMCKYRDNFYETWDAFKDEALKHAIHVEVKYGQVLFFSSCLLHGSIINTTSETRWCINTRFKSLFAPSGMHDILTYYRVLSMGPLTQIGLELK